VRHEHVHLPCAGEKYLTNEEADSKGSGPVKPVTATTDLYNAIEEGAHVDVLCVS
jgi:hypothetical protein